ncbi:hypothetical protein FJZ39_02305 [Candidatus Saccharibacteria bacterium]|nr:hypothetical protein [Candidatus Saccharibacteria bacterium]
MDKETSAAMLAAQRQLTKQLKILNTCIIVIGSSAVVVLAVLGVLLFQVVMAVQGAAERIESVQHSVGESLDINEQLCGGNEFLSQFQYCQR